MIKGVSFLLPLHHSLCPYSTLSLLLPPVIVAEVTQPSLGVGYELGRAVDMRKKIFCLFRPSSGRGITGVKYQSVSFSVSDGVFLSVFLSVFLFCLISGHHAFDLHCRKAGEVRPTSWYTSRWFPYGTTPPCATVPIPPPSAVVLPVKHSDSEMSPVSFLIGAV